MAIAFGKSTYRAVLTKSLLFAALATCVAASALLAQNTISGNFTLNESARFGNTVLSAGQYKFWIEPIGTVQSIRSIQQGAGHLVLVVLRPEKSGTVASVFALASPSGHTRETNELILEPEKTGTLAQSMYLEKEGLVVDFNWSTPRAKSQVVAQQTAPVQIAALRRSGGD
jgi:hypothetical protein